MMSSKSSDLAAVPVEALDGRRQGVSTRESIRLELTLTAEQFDALAAAVAEHLAASQPQPDDGWLTTAQAADYLGCSPDRLHDLVARRALTHGRDGRRLLFRRADLDAYVEGSS
jgi:excisionase family DNA binding protein